MRNQIMQIMVFGALTALLAGCGGMETDDGLLPSSSPRLKNQPNVHLTDPNSTLLDQAMDWVGDDGVDAGAQPLEWRSTNPSTGCVSKPSDFQIRVPFADTEEMLVIGAYGPTSGSALHASCATSGRANDYHALDFQLPQRPNSGIGQPVLAVAAGTVVKAGWATEGWRNYGQRVYIQHDYQADGHRYISVYAHLNAIYATEGQHVESGEAIGEMGQSCDGNNRVLRCPTMSAHLHFAIHQDSRLGGTGTGGSYGGRGVVPEPLDCHSGIVRGAVFYPGDCQPCDTVIGAQETILEDSPPCFKHQGTSTDWYTSNTGLDGHAYWTHTTANSQPNNVAFWQLQFSVPGTYHVWSYIPATIGQSRLAKYTIRGNGTEVPMIADQRSAPDSWLYLGFYSFSDSGEQWVKIADSTGESYSDNTKLAVDAVKIAPLGPEQLGPCEVAATGESVLDDKQSFCSTKSQNTGSWSESSVGYGNRSYWTTSNANAQPNKVATWKMAFAAAGDYSLWAYIPASNGKSRQAKYLIRHQGQEDLVLADQSTVVGGWLFLGHFDFAAGVDQWIKLFDNTGENSIRLAYDAIKLAPYDPSDLGPCGVVPTAESILDDLGPCMTRLGTSSFWYQDLSGYAGHNYWTETTSSSQADNRASWNLQVGEAGEYSLWAYIPAVTGKSRRARYTIRHAGADSAVVVDQTATANDWLLLGRFVFQAGGNQWVKLEDNTGEAYTTHTKLAFDAIKVSR